MLNSARLEQYTDFVHGKKVERNILAKGIASKKEKIKKLTQDKANFSECLLILQASALKVHGDISGFLNNVVSTALSTVFDDPYEFKLIFETKRNETECRCVFLRNGKERSPLDSAGFGAADVAAFAARAAIIKLMDCRKVMFADEPFRNVSPDRLPYVIDMVDTISKELGIQIILITNEEQLINYAQWSSVFHVQSGKIKKRGEKHS